MNILLPFGAAAVLLMIATLELVRVRRLRERYAALKTELASHHSSSRAEYRRRKNSFIVTTLELIRLPS